MMNVRKVENPEKATPAEIDSVLFENWSRRNNINGHRAEYRKHIAESTKDYDKVYYQRQLTRYIEQTAIELMRLQESIKPLEAEWTRRGGWQRWIICNSDGGHFHAGTGCHTLHVTSLVSWVADVSGLDERQLVEKVGHHACTVCFPWAPTTTAWTRTEKAEKAVKDAAKAEKVAKGIAVREKKVANITKRLNKAQALLDSIKGQPATYQTEYSRISAEHDIKWESDSLRWAQRDLDEYREKHAGK